MLKIQSVIIGLCLTSVGLNACGQHNKLNKTMITENLELAAPLVKKAIVALNEQDAKTWYSLFTDNATFSDDGRKMDFKKWCNRELFENSKCSVIRIDKVEKKGLNVYCLFHSDNYGDFKTFMNFKMNGDKFTSLDVGQVNY